MMALHSRIGSFLVAGAMLATVGFLACGDSGTDGDEPGAEGGAANAEPLFRAVQADLVRTCGGANGSCHVRGAQAPHWLGDPDPYLSAKKYRGIIPATQDVGDSIILTQVEHAGPSLKRFPDLYDRTASWITAETPQPPLPNTGAFFVVEGFNNINLDTVASGLAGGRLTFLATDGSNGTLVLTSLRFFAPPTSNVKVESPFFVILPRSGKVKAEPEKNGFKGELTIPAGTSVELFDGKMILTQWEPTGQLKIVFSKLETTPGQGPSGGCTALDVFKEKAMPALRAQVQVTGDDDNDGGVVDGGVIGVGSCAGCHGAGDEPDGGAPPAVNAMNLRALDTDPAVACGFARTHINFQNKPQSLILLNPQGKANPNHPVKPLAADDPIIKGLEAWVNAEQQ